MASGPDLSVTVNGLKLPNPFVIGSGPPGTNYAVMKRAFEDGWGAVIAKTVSLDSSKVGWGTGGDDGGLHAVRYYWQWPCLLCLWATPAVTRMVRPQ